MAQTIRPRQWLALGAILALAAFLRFWQLGSLPPGLYHDEAYNGLDALSLLQGKTFPQFYEGWELYAQDAHAENEAWETRWPIFFEGNYGREPLHVYLMAASIAVFGAIPFAVRAVPAAAGVLAVLTTFLAARALLIGWRSGERERDTWHYATRQATTTALLAALIMAILYPAVHFSRFGIRAMVFVPVAALVVFLFWQGINWPERALWWFVGAGFFLGLSLYTFAAARLLPLLFVIFVTIWFWRERTALRTHGVHVLAMAGAALLTALPLLWFFARYPYFFVFRIAYVANKGKGAVEGQPLMTWLLNVGRVFGGLFWYGETHLRHNLPGRPYLDPAQTILVLGGLWSTARRLLGLRPLFLLLWLGVMLLPSILSGDAPHFGRLSGAAAPLAILGALGAMWLHERLAIFFSRWMSAGTALSMSLLAVVGLLAASVLWTVGDYFVRYAGHPQLAEDFYLADWELGQYAARQPADSTLYLAPAQEEMATIYFALQEPTRLRSFIGSGSLLPLGIPGEPSLYLLRPEGGERLAQLQDVFPSGNVGEEQNGFVPFAVPTAPFPEAEHAADHAFDGVVKLVGWDTALDETGGQLLVRLHWQAVAPMARDYTAFVHLLDANGELIAQQDRPPDGYPTSEWRPGEIVVDRFAVDVPAGGLAPAYGLQTGFYYLPTLERLGEPAALDDWQP